MVQRLGAVDNLRNMVNILREVSFDEVRDDAMRQPSLLVVGPTETEARWFGELLVGEPGGTTPGTFSAPPAGLDEFDAVIVYDPNGSHERSAFTDHVRALPAAPPILRMQAQPDHLEAGIDSLRMDLIRRLPERAPAIGRAFPTMRAAAAKAIIDETAMANAQFALVSNIPAIIPVIGSIAAAGADFIVLTKNQVMMIYKLAAVSGRNLDDQIGIIQEIVPVVGAGFAWRSLARGVASMVPFAAGTLPKVAIAFAGTLVMGRAAEFYYRTNRRPTKAQFAGFVRQAQEFLGRLPQQITHRGDGGKSENGRSDE
ncbi:MAG TPA: hypothetical protein VER37_02715 [Thermomicrobiales bacterium]|nr:hypothetical protein [Thermomicrobiales bacterium]